MLFFMVKYLDSLDLKDMDIPQEGTRVSVWTNAMVRKAIEQDQRADGSFGMTPLKAEFRNNEPLPEEKQEVDSEENQEADSEDTVIEQKPSHMNGYFTFEDENGARGDEYEGQHQEQASILFSDPEVINRFIHMNAPSKSTPREIVNYREAISGACHGFEASLKMLIQKLAHRPQEKKRRRRKKKLDNKGKKSKKVEEAKDASDEKKDVEESDQDYECENLDADNTQTTVSLVDEKVDLSCSWRKHEETSCHQDARLQRRRNRVLKRSEETENKQPTTGNFGVPETNDQGTKDSVLLGAGSTEEDPIREKYPGKAACDIPKASSIPGVKVLTDAYEVQACEEQVITTHDKHTVPVNGDTEICLGISPKALTETPETSTGQPLLNYQNGHEETTAKDSGNLHKEDCLSTNKANIGSHAECLKGKENVRLEATRQNIFPELLGFMQQTHACKDNIDEHFQLEPPEFFDIGYIGHERVVFNDIMSSLKSISLEPLDDNLQRMNGNSIEGTTMLDTDMDPICETRNVEPSRKCVTVACHTEGSIKKTEEIMESPPRYRTRTAVAKKTDTPAKPEGITKSTASPKSRKCNAPNSKAAVQITPRRVTRSASRLSSDSTKVDGANTPGQ